MGLVIDTGIKGLGLEKRRESYYIYALEEEQVFLYPEKNNPRTGTVEMTKGFLKKLIDYFNDHPEELKEEK